VRRTRVIAALVLVLPLSAGAQSDGVPKRPRLDASIGADTNDARLYHLHGLAKLSKFPQEAADAFYWAARLDPAWADPLYARRVAVLMHNRWLRSGYLNDEERVLESAEMKQLDSLQLHAISLNPFLAPKLDIELFRASVAGDWTGAERLQIENALDDWLRQSGPFTRAWAYFSQGNYPEAIKSYRNALGSAKNPARVRANLARAYFLSGDRQKALEEMRLAVRDLRDDDKDRLVRVYESKAIYEHATGLIHEVGGATDSAKAAYGRALQEDLAYWPAHRQLGMLLLTTGDTAAAIAELAQAVQLKGDDAGLRYSYGYVLTAANKLDEAVAEFRKATELAPDYAAPYAFIARIYDAAGFGLQAMDYYEAFVARAARRDPQLPRATQRLTTLAAEADSAKGTRTP
jgi:tetratricopeptide (TPR) repeat protein